MARKGRGCTQNMTMTVLMRMRTRTRTWVNCIGAQQDNVTHWKHKLLFWAIQVCPGLPLSQRKRSFQKMMQKTTESHKLRRLIPKISKCYIIFLPKLYFWQLIIVLERQNWKHLVQKFFFFSSNILISLLSWKTFASPVRVHYKDILRLN